MAFKKPIIRPVLDIPLTTLERVLITLGIIAVIICFGIAMQSWPELPDSIPQHFNAAGQVDGWGDKYSLLTLPVLGLLLFALIIILGRFPHTYNYPVKITKENAPIQYQMGRTLLIWFGACIPWLFVYIVWTMVQTALGLKNGLNIWLMSTTILLCCAPLVIYLYEAHKYK
ncbi:MAG: DUF1648 domain-containing protein [Ignavibacteriales bacterium]